MKAEKVAGLCRCPKCGGENIFLMCNALHRFQVRCLDCGHRTRYKKKIEAVIDWFNMRLAVSDNAPKKRGRGRIKYQTEESPV